MPLTVTVRPVMTYWLHVYENIGLLPSRIFLISVTSHASTIVSVFSPTWRGSSDVLPATHHARYRNCVLNRAVITSHSTTRGLRDTRATPTSKRALSPTLLGGISATFHYDRATA